MVNAKQEPNPEGGVMCVQPLANNIFSSEQRKQPVNKKTAKTKTLIRLTQSHPVRFSRYTNYRTFLLTVDTEYLLTSEYFMVATENVQNN